MEWVLRSLIDPIFIWLALLTLIVVFFWRAKLRWAKVTLALFLALTFLASSLNLAFHAAQPLESYALENFKYADYRERTNIPCERYEGVIALGGVIPNSDFNPLIGIQVGSSAERAIEPVRLQRFCPNFKLIFTSFGKDLNGEVGESELARELWQDLGVNEDSIKVENQSTNTYENARESAKLLGVENRWLLVTSASHMKRAIESFRGFGMKVDPIPVDYLFSQSPSLLEFSIFDGLSIWRTISHEYFGIFYYRLTKWN
jgi:uncharacterized SAM-binding protein YcdF (DUF218 family)